MDTPGMNYSLIQTHVLEFCLFSMTLLIFILLIKFGVSGGLYGSRIRAGSKIDNQEYKINTS